MQFSQTENSAITSATHKMKESEREIVRKKEREK